MLAAVLVSGGVASAAPTSMYILSDRTGDANGANDQSEGLIRNVAVGHDVEEADLRRLRVGRLRNDAGRTTGYRLVLELSGPAGVVTETGTAVAYGVVMQLTQDCRIAVYSTPHRPGETFLRSSCDDPSLLGEDVPLRARTQGNTVIVDVPYASGPAAMVPGQGVEYTGALTHLAPVPGASAPAWSTQIDNALTYDTWILPG